MGCRGLRGLAAVTSLAVVAALVPSSGNGEGPRPNVVLISIDCMNQRQFDQAVSDGTAPNLAALARESQVWSRAYAHSPWTTPSHMSMLTGLYPSQHGKDISIALMGRVGDVRERTAVYETMADRLSAAGYETVAFVGMGSISGKWGLAQGFSLYLESDNRNETKSDIIRSEASFKAWLANRERRPFFLFLHTYDMHYPLPAQRSTIAAAIRYVDDYIGRVLTELRKAGYYDASVVFLTGDHGSEMLNAEKKCCMHGAGHYEENLRVPLLVKLPGSGSTGRNDELARHIDILPTVLDVVGLPKGSYRGRGTSLLAPEHAGDGVVSFSEADARCVSRRAVVTRRYKYIYTPQDPWLQLLRRFEYFNDGSCKSRPECASVPKEEFYDLETDPLEQKNLLTAPLPRDVATVLDGLRRELDEHLNLPREYRLSALNKPSKAAPTPEVDDGVKEALRALGYLQ